MATKIVYWDEIKASVKNIDPTLFDLIDALSPDKKYPLFVCSYNYGEKLGDHLGTFLKNNEGEFYRLGDSSTPKDISKHLSYGARNSPLLMLLDKTFEWEVSDRSNNIKFPIYVESAGHFVGIKQLCEQKYQSRTYLSSSIMSCSAGTKSAFMLPNIGNQRNHGYLQRKLGVHSLAPKHMDEHSHVFKEICDATSSSWHAKVLFFSKKWVDSLKNDSSWVHLKQFLIEKLVGSYAHEKNKMFFDLAFSRAEIIKNIQKSSFLNETAKHLIGIALGTNMGYRPATDSNSVPLQVLNQIYREVYKIQQTPFIMEPSMLSRSSTPVYYSLQHPIVCVPGKSNSESRALNELSILSRMMNKYIEAFSSENTNDFFSGTSLSEISDIASFEYFHNKAEDHDKTINSSEVIFKNDERFKGCSKKLKQPTDAKFFKGCIKVMLK